MVINMFVVWIVFVKVVCSIVFVRLCFSVVMNSVFSMLSVVVLVGVV